MPYPTERPHVAKYVQMKRLEPCMQRGSPEICSPRVGVPRAQVHSGWHPILAFSLALALAWPTIPSLRPSARRPVLLFSLSMFPFFFMFPLLPILPKFVLLFFFVPVSFCPYSVSRFSFIPFVLSFLHYRIWPRPWPWPRPRPWPWPSLLFPAREVVDHQTR